MDQPNTCHYISNCTPWPYNGESGNGVLLDDADRENKTNMHSQVIDICHDQQTSELSSNTSMPTRATLMAYEGWSFHPGLEQSSQLNSCFELQPLLGMSSGTLDPLNMLCTYRDTHGGQPSSSQFDPQLYDANEWGMEIASEYTSTPDIEPFLPEVNFSIPAQCSTETVLPAEERNEESHSATENTDDEDTPEPIGSVLSNGKYVCSHAACTRKTFGRLAELRRHRTTRHAARKPNFWCRVPTCRRSITSGGKAFHRKDKLADHVRHMHS